MIEEDLRTPGRGRRCIAAAIFPDDPLPENQTL
jgi:hypothetical protein